jgi:hypothetical protein
MYKQTGPAQAAAGAAPGADGGPSASGDAHAKGKSEGDVIDAEVVDEDKKKS